MEAAVRWSAYSTTDSQRFLIADVAKVRLRYCQVTGLRDNRVLYHELAQKEKLPNYTAFDWSRQDETLVAIGTSWGESRVVRLEPVDSQSTPSSAQLFPVKSQRRCNSISLNTGSLLATGLERIRNDSSLNIYDIRSPATGASSEPYRKLINSDSVSSVKFFTEQPETLIAGVSKQSLRFYDLRDPNPSGAAGLQTQYTHALAINTLDENYFTSAGTGGDNVVHLWDRRYLIHSSSGAQMPGAPSGSVLEFKQAVRASSQASIWSVRFSSYRRGCFGVLSSHGQIRIFETSKFDNVQDTRRLSSDAEQVAHEETHFTRRTQAVQYPWFDAKSGQTEDSRAIAFDFVSPGCILSKDDCLLTVRQNKTVEVLKIAFMPQAVALSSANSLSICNSSAHAVVQASAVATIAEDLLCIQEKVTNVPGGDSGSSLLSRSRFSATQSKLSSRERHAQLLAYQFPSHKLDLVDALTVQSTHRRRCQEGYLFSCVRNREIVRNDPWLMDLWETVKRLDDMAHNNGMAHEALDLSYLGVANIWKSETGGNPNRISKRVSDVVPDVGTAIKAILSRQRYDAFQGAPTRYPQHRQLCLAICGWRFNEKKLREKCMEILARGEHHKAIVVAMTHGRRDVAMDVLRIVSSSKNPDITNLAAVVATESLSKEQRKLCEWMVDDAQDPYQKALLTHFVTGSWNAVVAMKELPLIYRVAVALKYFSDDDLDVFLEESTMGAINSGDVEGIVLTGLAEKCMDLFERYIRKTDDLQTAVLVTAFTNPRYVDDKRWQVWKETYFWQMQSWKTFIERTRFTVQHNRKAVNRDGQRLIDVPKRQITLRCQHCKRSIAQQENGGKVDAAGMSISANLPRTRNPSAAAGVVCPKCGRHLPRCAICMLWLGTPDPSKPYGAAALSHQDQMSSFINFCMSCNHGFHAHHAREWFSKHQMCPVPDCPCLCGLRS